MLKAHLGTELRSQDKPRRWLSQAGATSPLSFLQQKCKNGSGTILLAHYLTGLKETWNEFPGNFNAALLQVVKGFFFLLGLCQDQSACLHQETQGSCFGLCSHLHTSLQPHREELGQVIFRHTGWTTALQRALPMPKTKSGTYKGDGDIFLFEFQDCISGKLLLYRFVAIWLNQICFLLRGSV